MADRTPAATDDVAAHVAENRRYWDHEAPKWVALGERAWARNEPTWGIWGVPNVEVPLLPDDLDGQRAIELGCGTGYVSAWMQRRGASVYAIDNSEQQLSTARRLADIYEVDDIDWVHGNAEAVDQPDESFDFAISEYGAAIWCDPCAWIPEAHRILKPAGRLVFLGNHPLVCACSPLDGSRVGQRLVRPYFGLHRVDWTRVEVDPGGIEFNLPVSRWFELFATVGFVVEDYLEPRPASAGNEEKFAVSADWAFDYPSEQVWKLKRR